MAICKNTFKAAYRYGVPERPAGDVAEAGRLITKSRRWWRKAAFPGTCQSTKGQVCG